jgi:serine/threonine-protein phosphatase 2B catalytic subunit
MCRDRRTLTIVAYSEEAENASELMAAEPPPSAGPSTAIDVLKVQGNQIRRNIQSFDDACVKLMLITGNPLNALSCRRRVDMANERRPSYTPSDNPFVPSMRRPEAMDLDYLIRRALEEDESGIVERLADRIASVRSITGQPRPLRRFDTA